MHFHASRILPAAIAAFCAVAALGGFALGFGLGDGHALAVACLLSGVALAPLLWLRYGPIVSGAPMLSQMMTVIFCCTAGLALYSNLSYLLWVLGFPMAIRAIETGAMRGNWWLGPVTLLWAVVCWWNIDKRKKRT